MGSGTISPDKVVKVIRNAFAGCQYEVYIASASLKEETLGNVHIAKRWEFDVLLEEAVLFINHGGQNSIVDGLIHHVPQIMVPGKVFERKYNASSIAAHGAGVVASLEEFDPEHIYDIAEQAISSKNMASNAAALGKEFADAGGIDIITREIG